MADPATFVMDDQFDAPAFFAQVPGPVYLEKSFSEFLRAISA
jgi:hypothetical protein